MLVIDFSGQVMLDYLREKCPDFEWSYMVNAETFPNLRYIHIYADKKFTKTVIWWYMFSYGAWCLTELGKEILDSVIEQTKYEAQRC